MTNRFKFTKFGLAEDPRGAQVAWQIGERRYLADVIGFYRDEVRCVAMLKTMHFNGEPGPDVCAAAVELLGWSAAAAHRAA